MIDQEKVREAVTMFLTAIGEDPNRPGLVETPDRIARMCAELFGGLTQTAAEPLAKRFPVDENNLVMEKDITFYSVCEHHLLPFYGKVHIAYVPDGSVVGLSKLARTVEVFARRPQIQEQLTTQIANAIMNELHPQGVMVMVEAEHMCMTMRGIKKPGTKTVTASMLGCFEKDVALQERFYNFLRLG